MGSRPGTILATDVFCLAFRRVRDFVGRHMQEQELIWMPMPSDRFVSRPSDGDISSAATSFVDDMTIVNADPRADQLMISTAKTFDILYEAALRVGMRLNESKTVAMRKFRQ